MSEGKVGVHTLPEDVSSQDLSAPLYVAWQLTNECNLACLHCIEESGPRKAFPDELDDEQVDRFLDQVIAAKVPYVAFSGGEPMLHPRFFEMAERVCAAGAALKVETNGHFLTPENCERFKKVGVKAVQVSLDGGKPGSFNRLRIRARFETVLDGIKNLRAAGVPLEINFCPTKFNYREIGRAVDRAHSLGAMNFYTGKTMYTGNAVKAWHLIAPSEDQYAEFFKVLHEKEKEYEGRMRVYFHEMGLLQELGYRLKHPAAILIVLPNGLVKIINALPFVCGDLRTQSLSEVWARFKEAWKDPQVARYVEEMGRKPELTAELHQWVRL